MPSRTWATGPITRSTIRCCSSTMPATSRSRVTLPELEVGLADGARSHLEEGTEVPRRSEITAEDVAFSFGPERLTGDQAPGKPMVRRYWVSLGKVEADGSLHGPFHHDLRGSDLRAAPHGLDRRRLSARRPGRRRAAYNAWRLAPVGAGPFKVERITPNDAIVLVAHDDYWGGKPNAKSGRVQGRAGSGGPHRRAVVERLRHRHRPAARPARGGGEEQVQGRQRRRRSRSTTTAWIWFDKTHPVLKDPRVRQAMILSIDRAADRRCDLERPDQAVERPAV